MFAYMCVYAPCVCLVPQRQEDSISTGISVSRHVGAGKQTCVFATAASSLSAEPPLQHPYGASYVGAGICTHSLMIRWQVFWRPNHLPTVYNEAGGPGTRMSGIPLS